MTKTAKTTKITINSVTLEAIHRIASAADPDYSSVGLVYRKGDGWRVNSTIGRNDEHWVNLPGGVSDSAFNSWIFNIDRRDLEGGETITIGRSELDIANPLVEARVRRVIVQHYHFDTPAMSYTDGGRRHDLRDLELRVPVPTGTAYAFATNTDGLSTGVVHALPRDLFSEGDLAFIDAEVDSIRAAVEG